MMPFSIFQPASAGLTEAPPRPGTVHPVKSLPLKSRFHTSADCSAAGSMKQSSVTKTTACLFVAQSSESVEDPESFRDCIADFQIGTPCRFVGAPDLETCATKDRFVETSDDPEIGYSGHEAALALPLSSTARELPRVAPSALNPQR